MSITLYHHPWSRAATVVWMLEELGVPYDLAFVDIQKGAQKDPGFLKLNPMGKLPTLVDDGVVLTESAAIALQLGDRYGLGELAPALDDPARATYYRWILYGPSVIEPGCTAHAAKWSFNPGSVGWGGYDAMLDTIDAAIGDGPWLLGERFTMADVVLGGTLGWMLQFDMIEGRDRFVAYDGRLKQREARLRADAVNQRVMVEHGVGQ
jgi:glutathione S-transferase